ncbi:hypothetical protein A5757_10000 [Mycobacterium sp. 852013-51886_SCH5428379]|uniref:hypothetical protein n=1 Tax=Mycobacterium sp. 852013-51886_SCH5428379 TaxID=1834111 RepID=UPI0007FC84BE|nr:hypothetical protein [Mycobacterium sp. 852013-51886_SCH5428379]OBB60408.1 hypothetical protein A5757_10000 [Mycobacterium sp. 852013-51886_SCH5428379]
MTTFAPHRATLESVADCMNGGADTDTLTSLLDEDVVLHGPFSNEPIIGRGIADTHHGARFRPESPFARRSNARRGSEGSGKASA